MAASLVPFDCQPVEPVLVADRWDDSWENVVFVAAAFIVVGFIIGRWLAT